MLLSDRFTLRTRRQTDETHYHSMRTIIIIAISILHLVPSFGQSISLKTIASSFCQGEANNCASIALIKAAMLKYGYNKIFDVQVKDNGYKLKLRDGTTIRVEKEEFEKARKKAEFEFNDKLTKL